MASSQAPKRKRNPESTHYAILDAAQTCLAKDGAEGVSVSAVAKLAGVNRGTAYQHFHSKEELIRATLERVSLQLLNAVFDFEDKSSRKSLAAIDPKLEHLPDIVSGMIHFNLKLAEYTIDNPDISRIWLFDVLSRDNPKEDVFYKRFEESLAAFASSDACEPGIDSEAHAVMLLSGFFMWPTWAGTQTKSKKGRAESARRYAGEVIRLSLYGVIKTDTLPIFESHLLHI